MPPLAPLTQRGTLALRKIDIAYLARFAKDAAENRRHWFGGTLALASARAMVRPYYDEFANLAGLPGKWALEDRWVDVRPVVDLRPNDVVLDVGCAEGLITLDVAPRVRSVLGIEMDSDRYATACELRAKKRIDNARFQCASICAMSVPPDSYDVVLFLGVYHHLPATERDKVLKMLLSAARRQLVLRTPTQGASCEKLVRMGRETVGVAERITKHCYESGFHVQNVDSTGIAGDLFVATRRQEPVSRPHAIIPARPDAL